MKAVHDKGAIFFCQIWHSGRTKRSGMFFNTFQKSAFQSFTLRDMNSSESLSFRFRVGFLGRTSLLLSFLNHVCKTRTNLLRVALTYDCLLAKFCGLKCKDTSVYPASNSWESISQKMSRGFWFKISVRLHAMQCWQVYGLISCNFWYLSTLCRGCMIITDISCVERQFILIHTRYMLTFDFWCARFRWGRNSRRSWLFDWS